jgi:hypothetical protein
MCLKHILPKEIFCLIIALYYLTLVRHGTTSNDQPQQGENSTKSANAVECRLVDRHHLLDDMASQLISPGPYHEKWFIKQERQDKRKWT